MDDGAAGRKKTSERGKVSSVLVGVAQASADDRARWSCDLYWYLEVIGS